MLPQGTLPQETVSGVMDELKTSIQLNQVITVDRVRRLEELMRKESFQLVAELLQMKKKIKDFKQNMIVDDQVMQELEEAREQNSQHQLKITKWVQEYNAMKQQIEEKQQALDNFLMEKSGDEVSTPQENP